ncbi:enoyl-CoA delta isomerase 1, mitochondrial-like [Calliphora vicina]|uniref:enoyl-CoA delta isomerase 1, mitochondrial-like n=1 Tax=Calliphora vicina TaxID=7373 RepID=UPI00325A799B
MLRSLRINLKITKPALRCFSSEHEKLITVETNNKTGIATLSLNRPPVNSLNLELLQTLKETINNLEDNKCQGLILTAKDNGVFTSGLDINELYEAQKERLEQFYAAFQDTWLVLYSSRLPTAALINGHSPAGGCVYATCCDFRVMLSNLTIGLNETKLGLVAPKYVTASFCNALPNRAAELALTQGKMFTTDEAFKVGLIDELATSKKEGLNKCEQFLASFKGVNSNARAFTKLQFRKSDIEAFQKERNADLNVFVSRVLEPKFQQQLGKYIENLRNKNK